jgi:hypothetical protein
MQSYLVKLDFKIAFAECDETPGRTPPGTPEEVAGIEPEMELVLEAEQHDELKTRHYRCEMMLPDENNGAAAQAVVDMFKHLPRFEVIAAATEPVEQPTATPATREYAVVCHFRSVEAFFRLSRGFNEHISEGLLFPAPKKPGRFVAYVVMHAPSSDGLEKAIEGVLRTAFDAHSAETADRFAEVTTNLL